MDKAAGQLQQLGFGQYEAQAYIHLLQQGPLNGYELAKVSGIPRANIYGVLQKLEERGAVLRSEGPGGSRYSAVNPQELLARLGSQFQSSLQNTQSALEGLACPSAQEQIWTAKGYTSLLEHSQALINTARDKLLLAIWPAEAAALSDQVRDAHERGVEITTLCLAGCPQECSHCQGKVSRNPISAEKRARWLIVVPDGGEVLAGEVSSNDDTLLVRTRQRMFVALAAWYIRHNIALSSLLMSLGNIPGAVDSPEVRAIFSDLKEAGGAESWLEALFNRPEIEQQPKSLLE